MSINGHFSHYDATPADAAAGDFFANRLLDPSAATDTAAYFRAGTSTSLLYSVGCHSGLNVVAGAINSGAPALYSADFPQAVLKQGGNWIGNTGYGYGDSDLIGYSERLALLFTKQIGRNTEHRRPAVYRRANRRFAGARQARLCAFEWPGRLQRLRRKGDRGDDAVRPAVYSGEGAVAHPAA